MRPILCLALALSLALAACGGSSPSSAPAAPPANTAAPVVPANTEAPAATAAPAGVTLAQYTALETGMTYEAVVAAIGEPTQELSSTDIGGIKTVMYMWNGTGLGGNMNAMFQDGKLTTKSQFGLTD